ncbi:SH3 domain-containing protein [Streptomyces sp. col6]|uniref:SH3 domain-containing protein n=1 Tax=Streptomyces sp. col6 TaxID=2478958 RepID=UPI00174693E7|nr:SH3 domain-containing protein [Streptomyces sp. col6]
MSHRSTTRPSTSKPRRLRMAVASAGVSLLAISGTMLATAPSASATGKSACTVTYDLPGYTTSGSVNLRTSPTTNSTSKGLLSKGTGFDAICGKGNWVYAYIRSGAHKYTYGWVYSSYVRIGG